MSDSERFFRAIEVGDRQKMVELLDRHPELVDARDPEGRTGLLLAVYLDERELVDLLKDRRPATDVFEAAASGDPGRVRELLREDPGLAHETSPDGFSPLGLASFFGHPEVVQILLGAGIEPNVRSRNTMEVMPLHSAAANRDPDSALAIARQLLDAGAEPSPAQPGGWTPLHQAASHGNLPLVRLLLERGADPDARSDDGRVPSDMARQADATEVVRVLAGWPRTGTTDQA